MNETLTALAPETNPGEGWLILRVALPRLAKRLEQVHLWLDRFHPERFVEAADELRPLAGAEGLALLAAVPPDRRADALDRVKLDDTARSGLRAVAERLGDPEDERSPAAALVRMVPSVAMPAMEVPGDDARGVAMLLGRAERAYERAELRTALELAQSGLDRLRAGGTVANRELEADALTILGRAYQSVGQLQGAIDFHEQALEIAQEIGDRRGEGRALGNLGIAYKNLGQPQRAIDFHQQCLTIARERGDLHDVGAALGNLGIAFHHLGQPQQAIECYQQALALSRKTANRHSEAADLGNLGNVYANLGQLQKAIDFYQQQLDISRGIGDRVGEANALGNLGIAYKNLGQPQQALECYQQQLAITRNIGDRRGEAISYWNLGNLLVKLDRGAEAIPLLETSVRYEQEIGHPEAEKLAARVAELKQRLTGADAKPLPGSREELEGAS